MRRTDTNILKISQQIKAASVIRSGDIENIRSLFRSWMANPSFNYQFRLILIGDSTVGKSSLLQYFYEGKLASTPEPTVGVDFFSRNILLADGTVIKLRLWDTAGQEKFK